MTLITVEWVIPQPLILDVLHIAKMSHMLLSITLVTLYIKIVIFINILKFEILTPMSFKLHLKNTLRVLTADAIPTTTAM